jgi:hypothetical protein
MRHTIKPLLCALLALLALAALTTTAASAATCKKGEEKEAEHKTLCIEGKQVGSLGKEVTTAAAFTLKTGTTAVLNVPAQNWSVVCARVETYTSPVIKSGGSGQVTLEELGLRFSECKVLLGEKEEPACSAENLNTYALAGSLALPESVTLATNTEAFGELDIVCAVLGGASDIPIKGYQGCSLKQPEVEAVAKELLCEPTNSHLKFHAGYGGPPTLKLEGNLALAGTSKGKKFSINK